mmetsp:Transcript_39630/g.88793  ORF Transcript_39630/g.88793 Transcript_39630/m.88793 type:complete len:287 (-) Transcript_39630:105-965(-)
MDDGLDSPRRDLGISTSWISLGVLVVTFLLLPEKVLCFSEDVWKLQQSWRRELSHVFRSASENVVIRAILDACKWLLRKMSRGAWASPCLPPHSLRARLGGPKEVLVLWTAHHQANPCHEETYVVAWQSNGEKPVWQEEAVTENLCEQIGGAHDRWGAILDLPDEAVTRIRVCAVNRLGRGDWSREEIEVTTTRAKHPGARIRLVLAKGVQACANCSNPMSKKPGEAAYAELVCRSVFEPDCKHGPFCLKCRERVAQKVLPCCVCRGLIQTWRQVPPEDAEETSCT